MTSDPTSALNSPWKGAVSFLFLHSSEPGIVGESRSSGMLGEVPEQQRNCRLLLGCA